MKRGRKIVVNGLTYQWRYGGASAVIWDENDTIYHPTMFDLTGLNNDVFERGQWKRTKDGMITPCLIAQWIKENIHAS